MLGVSTSTVRRSLKDFPDISKETKERVRRATEQLNYRPNFLARAMITKKTMILGVLVPEFGTGFFPVIIDGLREAAGPDGYNIMIAPHAYAEMGMRKSIEMFNRYMVDGLIVAPAAYRLSPETVKELSIAAGPVVLIDDDLDRAGLARQPAWVGSDDERIGADAAQYIADTGHTHVWFVGFDPEKSSSFHRRDGVAATLKRNKLAFGADALVEGGFSEETGRLGARKALAVSPMPDAMICASDQVAMGAMLELLANGVKIPEQISVMGVANLFFSHALPVPLTTIDQSPREIGRKAFELFTRSLDGVMDDNHVYIPHSLVERSSTRDRRSG